MIHSTDTLLIVFIQIKTSPGSVAFMNRLDDSLNRYSFDSFHSDQDITRFRRFHEPLSWLTAHRRVTAM